jgi:hypothetical protein
LNSGVFSEASLEHLVKWPALRSVSLYGTPPISDTGLAHLAKIDRLFRVMIGNAQGVSDAGLAHFKSHPSMRILNLSGSRITDNGIAALRQSVPECSVQK